MFLIGTIFIMKWLEDKMVRRLQLSIVDGVLLYHSVHLTPSYIRSNSAGTNNPAEQA
jgi:hypothetical protein